MRALVFAVVLVAAGCDLFDDASTSASPSTPSTPPPPATRAAAAAAQKSLDDCRDGCEQSAIVAGAGDDVLRACRARCDARFGAAATAHEVPSRITRASPFHTPPAVRPRRP